MLDQIKGGLFGVAIGDALGGTTEFMSEREIKNKYGQLTDIIGGGIWHLKPGEVTDDTAMTLCVAKGIIESPDDPIPYIGGEFLKWYNQKPKDVGIIISQVLTMFKDDWEQAAKDVHYQLSGKSAGNGSLMRCLPIPLAYTDPKELGELTIRRSKMTHYDDLAAEACLIYNRIASRLLHGDDLDTSLKEETAGTIYEDSLINEPDCLPDGFVVHTMKWVVYFLSHMKTFEEAAVAAANKGHDTDTVAAIVCGLKGIEVGYEQLPQRFKEKILISEELCQVANELLKIRKARS